MLKRLLATLAALLLGASASLASEPAPEPAVRAALLFNFLKFTEWPAAAGIHPWLHVCVASNDPDLFTAMEALGTRYVRDKQLTVARFKPQADCEVIYVDARQRWISVTDRPLPPHTLTIGDYKGFTADGGIIEIAQAAGKTGFDINLQEAKRAGLRFYPQLLRLARTVLE